MSISTPSNPTTPSTPLINTSNQVNVVNSVNYDENEIMLILRDDFDLWKFISREFIININPLIVNFNNNNNASSSSNINGLKDDKLSKLNIKIISHKDVLNGPLYKISKYEKDKVDKSNNSSTSFFLKIINPIIDVTSSPSMSPLPSPINATKISRSSKVFYPLIDGLLDLPSKPYFNILVVKCEDPDNYKTELRPIIISFLDEILANISRQESILIALNDSIPVPSYFIRSIPPCLDLQWLIVYLPLGSKVGGFLSQSSSDYTRIVDYINDDISKHAISGLTKDNENRCHKLDMFDSSIDHRPQWNGFINALKLNMVTALESRLNILTYLARAYDSCRGNMASFDATRYFIYKEMSIHVLIQMTKKDELVKMYDEMNAVLSAALEYSNTDALKENSFDYNLPTCVEINSRLFREKLYKYIRKKTDKVHLLDLAIYIFSRTSKYLDTTNSVQVLTRAINFFKWASFEFTNPSYKIAENSLLVWLIRSFVDLVIYSLRYDAPLKLKSLNQKQSQFKSLQCELLECALKYVFILGSNLNYLKFNKLKVNDWFLKFKNFNYDNLLLKFTCNHDLAVDHNTHFAYSFLFGKISPSLTYLCDTLQLLYASSNNSNINSEFQPLIFIPLFPFFNKIFFDKLNQDKLYSCLGLSSLFFDYSVRIIAENDESSDKLSLSSFTNHLLTGSALNKYKLLIHPNNINISSNNINAWLLELLTANICFLSKSKRTSLYKRRELAAFLLERSQDSTDIEVAFLLLLENLASIYNLKSDPTLPSQFNAYFLNTGWKLLLWDCEFLLSICYRLMDKAQEYISSSFYLMSNLPPSLSISQSKFFDFSFLKDNHSTYSVNFNDVFELEKIQILNENGSDEFNIGDNFQIILLLNSLLPEVIDVSQIDFEFHYVHELLNIGSILISISEPIKFLNNSNLVTKSFGLTYDQLKFELPNHAGDYQNLLQKPLILSLVSLTIFSSIDACKLNFKKQIVDPETNAVTPILKNSLNLNPKYIKATLKIKSANLIRIFNLVIVQSPFLFIICENEIDLSLILGLEYTFELLISPDCDIDFCLSFELKPNIIDFFSFTNFKSKLSFDVPCSLVFSASPPNFNHDINNSQNLVLSLFTESYGLKLEYPNLTLKCTLISPFNISLNLFTAANVHQSTHLALNILNNLGMPLFLDDCNSVNQELARYFPFTSFLLPSNGSAAVLFATNDATIKTLTFDLQFHFGNNSLPSRSSVRISANFPTLKPKQESIIEIYFTKVACGDLISFNYSICILNNNFAEIGANIYLSVDLDSANNHFWAPAGKSKYFIDIKSESFVFNLLPLVNGLLPLPKLNLSLFTTKNDFDSTINKINPVDSSLYKIFLKSDTSHIKV